MAQGNSTNEKTLTVVNSIAASLLAVFCGYGLYKSITHVQDWHKNSAVAQLDDAKLKEIFQAADVPPGQENLVKEILFNQNGDCARLNETLETACEKAKLALHAH